MGSGTVSILRPTAASARVIRFVVPSYTRREEYTCLCNACERMTAVFTADITYSKNDRLFEGRAVGNATQVVQKRGSNIWSWERKWVSSQQWDVQPA